MGAIHYHVPVLYLSLRRDADGWAYDGPIAYAPQAARRAAGGPLWQGPITRQYAVALLKTLRRQGYMAESVVRSDTQARVNLAIRG